MHQSRDAGALQQPANAPHVAEATSDGVAERTGEHASNPSKYSHLEEAHSSRVGEEEDRLVGQRGEGVRIDQQHPHEDAYGAKISDEGLGQSGNGSAEPVAGRSDEQNQQENPQQQAQNHGPFEHRWEVDCFCALHSHEAGPSCESFARPEASTHAPSFAFIAPASGGRVLAGSPMKLQLTHPSIGTFAFELQPGVALVLGRDTDEADLELPWDPHVSRRHAMVHLERGTGTVTYQDLDSTNGSRRDGAPVSGPISLRPGDRVLLGDTSLALMPPDQDPWAETTEPFQLVQRDALRPPVPSSPAPQHPDAIRVRFVGPSRVRIEGSGLQALWREQLKRSRLFVPGACPVGTGARVWVDLSVEADFHELPAEVSGPITDATGLRGTLLVLGPLPNELEAALRKGVDSTAIATMEIEPPPDLLASVASEPLPSPSDTQRFVGAVVSNRPYEALGLTPAATDAEVQLALDGWGRRADSMLRANAADPLAGPLSRAVAMVRAVLGDTGARLRFDFSHGHVLAERRRAWAQSGAGPSLEHLAATWRRTFPARVERAQRLRRSAAECELSGRPEEAEQLRLQARRLAPFQER